MGYEEVKYRWTGEDWANAAAARKAKDAGAQPLPKILVTPYGLSPFQFYTDGVEGSRVVIKSRVYLASDTADKKALAAWDIAVGAYVMLPLELAKFGEPFRRDQFYKKGQAWIPRPDKAKGGTLLSLCRSLHETGEPQLDVYHFFSRTKPDEHGGTADKTSQEWDLDAPVRERILSKLVGHWKNTEYHFEQLRQGLPLNGDLPVPLKSAEGADVTLEVVLAEPPPPPAPKPVAPQGPSGGPGSGATLTLDTPAPGSSPPPPPFDKLPDPLKVTLVRSYQDRKDGEPDAANALSTYYAQGSNVWEAIGKGMDWQDINTMVRVHQRMEAVDKTGALWRDHVKYLIRAYRGGIYALEMVYTDRDKLRAYLDGDLIKRNVEPKLARGVGWTQCMHENTDGWREVSDTDQLHINIANIVDYKYFEDCHIDEMSFTKGRDEEGKSIQAWDLSLGHFSQSQLQWIDIERPFAKLELIVHQDERDRTPMRPETEAAFKEWSDRRGIEAVSGEPGHQKAVKLLHQIWDDDAALHEEIDG